jgi:hypothetical protein
MTLTYRDRRTSGTQLDVMSGEIRVATLWNNKFAAKAGDGETWKWSWTLSAGPPMFEVHGTANSKYEAQAVIEGEWRRWFDAAGLREK